MATLQRLGAEGVRSTITAFRDALVAHADLLDRLNVYPVPDGDTGTNMARTVEAVVVEMDAAPGEMASTCRAISHGSLMGARGNSGVILSQILRGVVGVFGADAEVTGRELADGLRNGAAAAYCAVLRPVEGTILTVAREAANAAERAADAGGTLLGVLEAARDAGRVALDRTPELLPVLKEAGVVDAGGAGFLLFLDAALSIVDGQPLPEPPTADAMAATAVRPTTATPSAAGLRYEVMYFLDLVDDRIDDFRAAWGAIGDSVVVVGGDGTWNCHLHTDDVGAAVEVALDVGGRPRAIRVTDLLQQVGDRHAADDAERLRPPEPVGLQTTAVVAVAAGEGAARLFRDKGVSQIVRGGQTSNPSTAELLAAVDAVPAGEVVLLPGNKNIVAVAGQVDALSAKSVGVVATVSVVQGLLALEAWDPDAGLARNVEAMSAAAASVRCGEVTRAVRAATPEAGPVAAGDWIGLIGSDSIVACAADVAGAATQLLAVLLDKPARRVVLLTGEGASDAVTATLRHGLDAAHPELQVEVHEGGQPLYAYLFGVQ